jgi:hypothetical protein
MMLVKLLISKEFGGIRNSFFVQEFEFFHEKLHRLGKTLRAPKGVGLDSAV